MNLILPNKIIATTLLGIVFLLGGVSIASAAPTTPTAGQTAPIASTQGSVWAYQQKASAYATTFQFKQFPTQTACQAAVAADQINQNQQCIEGTSASFNQAQQGNTIAATNTGTAGPKELKGFDCGVFGTSKIMDCLPIGTYYFVYKPVSYLLMGGGYIFDKALNLSISEPTVNQGFVSSSWKVIRDFSNMLFIFILLYTGISTMLGAKDWRGVVLKVIVIALLINFSLFFTKVVIDAGNVLAVGVYDAIIKEDVTHSTSERLAKAFEPQVFLDTANKPGAMDAIIVFIIAAVVNGFAAYTFFRAGLLFVGRLIAFWFLMIISPFAFISTALPKGNIFSFWWETLLSQAFVAPVYLFLIYLILQIIAVPGGIVGNALTSSKALTATHDVSWFDGLIPLILMAIMLVFAMQKALKLAEGMAGDFGTMGAKMAGSVLGVAGGVALGGTALAGRAVGGRIAQGLQERGTFQKMATSEKTGVSGIATRFAGRQLFGVNEKARTGTWDARGTGLGQKGLKATGVDFGKPSAGAKGGYEGAIKQQDQKDLKFAKKLEVTDAEKDAISKKYDVVGKEAEKEKQQKNVDEYAGRVKEAEGEIQNLEKSLKEALGTQDTVLQKVLAEAVDKKKQALASIKTDLEKVQGTAEEVAKIASDAKKAATKEIDEENKRRKGSYADYTGGKVRTAVRFATGNATYSHKQAQATAAKLRAGGDAAKPTEEKKDIEKVIDELVKKEIEKKEKTAH